MTQEEKNKVYEEIFDSESTLGVHYSNADIEVKFGVNAVEYRLWKAKKNCQKAYAKLGITPEAKKNTAIGEPQNPFLKNCGNNTTCEGGVQAAEPTDVQNFDDSAGNAPNAESTTPADETVKVAGSFDSARGVDDRQRIQALIERGNVTADELTEFKPFVNSAKELLPVPITYSQHVHLKGALYYVLEYGCQGTVEEKVIWNVEEICAKLKITPTIEHISTDEKKKPNGVIKRIRNYHWELTPVDFLKIVAYVADNYATRAKTHKTSTPIIPTSFGGELLNYGADILAPSNEDVKSELSIVNAMDYDERKALRIRINQLNFQRVLMTDRKGNGYICPICGNGSGESGDGITPYESEKGNVINHCFKCGFHDTNIDLISEVTGLEWKSPKVLAIGLHLLNLAEQNKTVNGELPPLEKKVKEISPEYLALVRADIAESKVFLEELPEVDRRGLTIDTLQHFGVGYIQNWIHPVNRLKNENLYPSRRLIVPTSERHYLAAVLKSDRASVKKDYWKQHAGNIEMFNSDAVVPNHPVIITEGEIDALSLLQVTNGAVNVAAVGGTSGYARLSSFLNAKELSDADKLDYFFIVCLDNDEAGRKAAADFVEKLICAGYPAIAAFLSDGDEKIDANDLLIKEGDAALADRVSKIITDAESKLDDIKLAVEEKRRERESRAAQKAAVSAQIGISEFVDDTSAEISHAEKAVKDAITSLTAEQAHDNALLRQVALCDVYGVDSAVNDFVDAAVQGGYWHKRDLQRRIEKLVKEIKGDIARVKAARKENEKSEALKRLAELKSLPPADGRNAEIYRLLKHVCLDWKVDLRTKKKLYPLPTFANFKLLFDYDPCLCGLLGYDEFADREVFLKNPNWDNQAAGRPIEDSDVVRLRLYLRESYNDFAADKLLDDCVIEFSRRNSFHRVKEFLEGLHWDGVRRAESLFIDRLGVEDNSYTREVTLKWLIAAVARIYNPACNFQWALTLQGAQGIGKSYILERLGGAFFTKLVTSFDDQKAAAEIIQGSWIVELEEFSAARRAEINNTKSFLSRSIDTFRPAYGRREKNFRRHCVFAVTVNGQNFLRDMTGNRRFVVLECGLSQGDFKGVIDDDFVNQIWAEIFVKYKELFKDSFDANFLNLSDSAKTAAEIIADKFVADDDLTSEIKSFLDIPIPEPCIWLLLTKAERRKFFEEGSIYLTQDDLSDRFKTLPAKFQNDEDFCDRHTNALSVCTADRRNVIGRRFYGTNHRENVCAAEIYNECFSPADKRKSIARISDVLDRLENWKQGTRLRNDDPQYKDKKKCHYYFP